MKNHARKAAAWVAVLAGLVALQYAFSGRRPLPLELRASREFVVTTMEDDGPGSLREAIFATASAPGRARIQLPIGRLVLRTSLPPFVNSGGVVIEGAPGVTEIDAGQIEMGAVLDIDAPNSLLKSVRITNAVGQAVVARKNGLTIVDSSFVNCGEAVHAVEGLDGLVVERTTFTNNRTGVWIGATRGRAEIRDSQFSRHEHAAVWIVRQPQLDEPLTGNVVITRNRFDHDRISLVLANTSLLVENNEFTGASDAALLLLGKGAVVRNNRIRNGSGVGLIADNADGAVIEGNEINHNATIGVLVRSSGGALVRGNRLYQNGYGLAFVFGRAITPNVGVNNTLLQHTYDGVVVIGDSPVLQENYVLNGSHAGLRILDYYSPTGARTRADPLVQRNHIEGNGGDPVIRGEYRAPAKQVASR